MDTMYTCDCVDGRTITGSAKWTPGKLKQMSPLQLAEALDEAKDFASYYSTHFYYPLQMIEAEKETLLDRYNRTKKICLIFGVSAAVFTFLWIILAAIPALRFSNVTLGLAILTFFSLLLLIPILCRMISTQQDYTKRIPRLCTKQEKLVQQQEKAIYGTYSDFLISNFLLCAEYGLFEEGLELMIQALNTRKASTLAEAVLLCKKKYPRSPVPRLVASLRSVSSAAHQEQIKAPDKPPVRENQRPELRTLLQMSEHLTTAIKGYAATQERAGTADTAALNYEEENLLLEFRALSPEERSRISRIIHSFYSKQY